MEKNLEGLRGWLLFVGFSIIVRPIYSIYQLVPIYLDLYKSGAWAVLTDPQSTAYHPLWGTIIFWEVLLNAALLVACAVNIYFFFTKDRRFPLLYISIIVGSLAFIILDALSVGIVLPNEPVFDPDTNREIGRAFFAAVIWIPYLRISKRVMATFVN